MSGAAVVRRAVLLAVLAVLPAAVVAAQAGAPVTGFVVELPDASTHIPAGGFVLPGFDRGDPSPSQALAPKHVAREVPPFCCDEKRFWIAASELMMIEVIPWYFNRHVADDETAALSWNSWVSNLEQGFEWDTNDFRTNMFMHPFHGSLYFNAARANGYSYWESAAFSWAGSMLWEMFGENNRGAINDWASTSMGGMAIGEAFHRAATTIRDNRATGAARGGREFAAFMLDPVGGINRVFRGEATRVGENPVDRFSGASRAILRLGLSTIGDTDSDAGGTESLAKLGYFDGDLYYGDPFAEFSKPFDSFELRFELGQGGPQKLTRLQVEGVLLSEKLGSGEGDGLGEDERAQHRFTLTQHYDYLNTFSAEVGGQSLGASFFSRYPLSDTWRVKTVLQPTASLIWGVSSDYATVFVGHGSGSGSDDEADARSYDFGSGAGFRGRAYLQHRGADILEIYYLGNWSHTLNGAAGSHFIQYLGARAQFPIFRSLGVGAEYQRNGRNSNYRDFDDVHLTGWQFRVFLGIF